MTPQDMTSPMLLKVAKGMPANPDAWVMEPKFDGWRFIVHIDSDRVAHAYTRTMVEAYHLWDVEDELPTLFPPDTILDMEITTGKTSTDVPVVLAQRTAGKLQAWVFDILQLDGVDLTDWPWDKRRHLLELALDGSEDGSGFVRLAPVYQPVQQLLDEWISRGIEGCALKRRDSKYYPGRRSADW